MTMTAQNPLFSTRPAVDQPWSRDQLVALVEVALAAGEYRYARRASLAWLACFPGDMPVSLLHARSLLQEGQAVQALPILERLCQLDPEFLQAQTLLASTRRRLGEAGAADAEGCVIALGGEVAKDPRDTAKGPSPREYRWGKLLLDSRKLLDNAARQIEAKGAAAQEGIDPAQSEAIERAGQLVLQAIVEKPSSALTAVTHLNVESAKTGLPKEATLNLVRAYHERWPNCLTFSLTLADLLMGSGQPDQAVALLHQVAAEDITGQIPLRLWGKSHPYRALWPECLEASSGTPGCPQELPIPASVAALMGWNRLGGGSLPTSAPTSEAAAPTDPDKKSYDGGENFIAIPDYPIVGYDDQYINDIQQYEKLPPNARPFRRHGPSKAEPPTQPNKHRKPRLYNPPEALLSAQKELREAAERLKQPGIARMDGRFPMYVVLSTRTGLIKQYGEVNAALIDLEMRHLVEAVSSRKGWGAVMYYPDEPDCAPGRPIYELKAANPNDAWEIKLALTDLDTAMGKTGEMIGAVLIVGGPEVVPFHLLPNPVDDLDVEVPSDNPYATRDDNYFVPEWPVGRLPGGEGDDPALLLRALKRMIHDHESKRHSTRRRHQAFQRWWSELKNWWSELLHRRGNEFSSLGYSAAIWRRASLSVFRSIGDPKDLLVSPPLQVNGKSASTFLPLYTVHLGYFNLHGVPDSEEWYGQRDPTEPGEEIDFPVALRAEDIDAIGDGNGKGRNVPEVVFSEACYGAHILNKSIDQAISLKFLSAGCRAVVGSTATSYGSISTPLVAADLLGRSFWTFLGEGYATGEALRRAKIYMAREMHRRQGYLDGEDQKTLISFVLYGDPLAQAAHHGRRTKSARPFMVGTRPMQSHPKVHTVCDRVVAGDSTPDMEGQTGPHLPPVPSEVVSQVKQVVSQYLPGMEDAHILYSQERAGCDGHDHTCPTAQLGAKSLPNHQPHRRVITLSKTLAIKDNHTLTIHQHPQYARLTLDGSGKLVKLVVSR